MQSSDWSLSSSLQLYTRMKNGRKNRNTCNSFWMLLKFQRPKNRKYSVSFILFILEKDSLGTKMLCYFLSLKLLASLTRQFIVRIVRALKRVYCIVSLYTEGELSFLIIIYSEWLYYFYISQRSYFYKFDNLLQGNSERKKWWNCILFCFSRRRYSCAL